MMMADEKRTWKVGLNGTFAEEMQTVFVHDNLLSVES